MSILDILYFGQGTCALLGCWLELVKANSVVREHSPRVVHYLAYHQWGRSGSKAVETKTRVGPAYTSAVLFGLLSLDGFVGLVLHVMHVN
jgi:hypothetical protein